MPCQDRTDADDYGYTMTDFFLIQHGEKVARLADPPLTTRGLEQAERTAHFLRDQQIDRLLCSPARRARETAMPLAAHLALSIEIDQRLRERMEWTDDGTPQSFDHFLREWERATADRDFRPRTGDSSHVAGARLLAVLEDLFRADAAAQIALVLHGGVTTDLLRNLFGDRYLEARNPGLLATGPAGCAITRLRKLDGDYQLIALCSTEHLTYDQ